MISCCSAVNFMSGFLAANIANLNASDFSFQETFSTMDCICTLVGVVISLTLGSCWCLRIYLILSLSLSLDLRVKDLSGLLENLLTNLDMLLQSLLSKLSSTTFGTFEQLHRDIRLFLKWPLSFKFLLNWAFNHTGNNINYRGSSGGRWRWRSSFHHWLHDTCFHATKLLFVGIGKIIVHYY